MDTKALERLMTEDDGQIKLELQQSIIEEFSRRHIKAIANNSDLKNMFENVKKETLIETEKLFGEWKGSYNTKKFELNPQIKDMIRLQCKTAVTYELDKAESYVEELYKATAEKMKKQHEENIVKLNEKLENYSAHLMVETDRIKDSLLSDECDHIIRSRLKEILAESFGATK